MTARLPRRLSRIFHIAHGTPYHVENSITGLHKAKRAGFKHIDLDAQVTKDGHVVITHWSRPMLRDGFRDPLHKLGRHRKVASLTLEQVRRLRTRDGFRIHTAWSMFGHAADLGLAVMLEVKADRRFTEVEVMRQVRADANDQECVVRVMTLSNLGRHPELRLKAAKAAGFKTILLARGPIPTSWRPWVDFVRGPWRWTRADG